MEPRKLSAAAMVLAVSVLLVSGECYAQEDRTVGEHIDDASLAANVKFHLIGAEGVPANRLNVETFKGIVVLAGFVDSQAERIDAVQAVKDLEGVEKVVDAMVIFPTKRTLGRHLDDQTIHTKVDIRIRKKQGFSKVTVQVRDGHVLLGGFAETEDMREQAEEVARTVEGVERIYNKITVQA